MLKRQACQEQRSTPGRDANAGFLDFHPQATDEPARDTAKPAMAPEIESCVEALCQKGCRSVRADILALEQGKDLPETAALSREAIRLVLKHLKAIMAVYGDTCRID